MAALAATASRVGLVALLGGGALALWWSLRGDLRMWQRIATGQMAAEVARVGPAASE